VGNFLTSLEPVSFLGTLLRGVSKVVGAVPVLANGWPDCNLCGGSLKVVVQEKGLLLGYINIRLD